MMTERIKMNYNEALVEISGGGFSDVEDKHLVFLFKSLFTELEKRGVEFQCNEYYPVDISSFKDILISFN